MKRIIYLIIISLLCFVLLNTDFQSVAVEKHVKKTVNPTDPTGHVINFPKGTMIEDIPVYEIGVNTYDWSYPYHPIPGDRLGQDVAIGDINKDGYNDIFAMPLEKNMIFLSDSCTWKRNDPYIKDWNYLGYSHCDDGNLLLLTSGDINNDGFDDFVYRNGCYPRIVVIFGALSRDELSYSAITNAGGPRGISARLDFNGDGIKDLVISSGSIFILDDHF